MRTGWRGTELPGRQTSPLAAPRMQGRRTHAVGQQSSAGLDSWLARRVIRSPGRGNRSPAARQRGQGESNTQRNRPAAARQRRQHAPQPEASRRGPGTEEAADPTVTPTPTSTPPHPAQRHSVHPNPPPLACQPTSAGLRRSRPSRQSIRGVARKASCAVRSEPSTHSSKDQGCWLDSRASSGASGPSACKEGPGSAVCRAWGNALLASCRRHDFCGLLRRQARQAARAILHRPACLNEGRGSQVLHQSRRVRRPQARQHGSHGVEEGGQVVCPTGQKSQEELPQARVGDAVCGRPCRENTGRGSLGLGCKPPGA